MVVEALNARFRNGKPSNDLSAAGVLMRNFEGMAGRHSFAWEPCAADEFCARAGDRLASSIINAAMPHLYSFDAGGVVIEPQRARLLCSFHGDGNDFGRFCKPPTEWLKMAAGVEPDGSCVPGCTSRFGWCDDKWQPCPLCEQVPCAWRSSGLAGMMEAHAAKLENWRAHGQTCVKGGHYGRSKCHNELVLDADAWVNHMPQTFEAFFFQAASHPESVSQARSQHAAFVSRYGGGTVVPLVIYDESHSDSPFTLDGEAHAG